MSRGELLGPIVGAAGLLSFAAAAAAIQLGALDELIGAAAPVAGVLLVGVVAAWGTSRRGDVVRIHIRPHRDHAHGVKDAVIHEALGHAAVGAGVRGTTAGIRARVFPDGSGWCEVPRGRTTLAGSIAITRAGEYVAGPSGCESDRARAARELRQAPRRYRAQVSAEADRLVAQHAGSAFGRRLARSLERTGRFR